MQLDTHSREDFLQFKFQEPTWTWNRRGLNVGQDQFHLGQRDIVASENESSCGSGPAPQKRPAWLMQPLPLICSPAHHEVQLLTNRSRANATKTHIIVFHAITRPDSRNIWEWLTKQKRARGEQQERPSGMVAVCGGLSGPTAARTSEFRCEICVWVAKQGRLVMTVAIVAQWREVMPVDGLTDCVVDRPSEVDKYTAFGFPTRRISTRSSGSLHLYPRYPPYDRAKLRYH